MFTMPVRAALGSVFATFAGLSLYNYTSRPTTQTVQGIDNTTLMVIAGVAALGLWWSR